MSKDCGSSCSRCRLGTIVQYISRQVYGYVLDHHIHCLVLEQSIKMQSIKMHAEWLEWDST